jgi:hypothetical protein
MRESTGRRAAVIPSRRRGHIVSGRSLCSALGRHVHWGHGRLYLQVSFLSKRATRQPNVRADSGALLPSAFQHSSVFSCVLSFDTRDLCHIRARRIHASPLALEPIPFIPVLGFVFTSKACVYSPFHLRALT